MFAATLELLYDQTKLLPPLCKIVVDYMIVRYEPILSEQQELDYVLLLSHFPTYHQRLLQYFRTMEPLLWARLQDDTRVPSLRLAKIYQADISDLSLIHCLLFALFDVEYVNLITRFSRINRIVEKALENVKMGTSITSLSTFFATLAVITSYPPLFRMFLYFEGKENRPEQTETWQNSFFVGEKKQKDESIAFFLGDDDLPPTKSILTSILPPEEIVQKKIRCFHLIQDLYRKILPEPIEK
jgi:hypothetical protein